MRGYKVFNPDWTCRNFQYKVGETYKYEEEIDICKAGFHFCKKLVDCFDYYAFDSKNKVAIIEATGEIIEKRDCSNSKCVTNEIKIIKELSWNEVLDMVNFGEDNTGIKNTGDYNGGACNSGNCNNGDYNSGNYNTGNYNAGYYNSGIRNSGDYNNGIYNTGDSNNGNYNTGGYNTGIYNTGRFNIGNSNSGDYNSGSFNSGSFNSGNFNAGKYNIGEFNSGNYNSGSFNIGDCNLGNRKLGCFCTDSNEQQTIKLFNKDSDWTLNTWENSTAFAVMDNYFELTLWIDECNMTDKEKEFHPNYKTTKGYLKELSYKEAWENMWNRIDDEYKSAFISLPNFDKDIFKTITGIDIEDNK